MLAYGQELLEIGLLNFLYRTSMKNVLIVGQTSCCRVMLHVLFRGKHNGWGIVFYKHTF